MKVCSPLCRMEGTSGGSAFEVGPAVVFADAEVVVDGRRKRFAEAERERDLRIVIGMEETLGPELSRVLRRSLARAAGDRYETAAAFAADLARAAGLDPPAETARPAPMSCPPAHNPLRSPHSRA